jgi:hypothetical protein
MTNLSATLNPSFSFVPRKTDGILQQRISRRDGEKSVLEVDYVAADFIERDVFRSEIKRIDSEISQLKKNQEKNSSDVLKRFDKMEHGIGLRFEKVDACFDKLEHSIDQRLEKVDVRLNRFDDRLWWIFGAILISILLPIIMKYL